MSELGGASSDADLWSLVSIAEQSYQELEDMASSIEELSEEALAAEAEHLGSPCCHLSGRVTSSFLGHMNELLELALSDEFRKYTSLFRFLRHMSVTASFFLRVLCLVSLFIARVFFYIFFGFCSRSFQSSVR